MNAPAADRRAKLSRAIHAAARAKGLDEDTYRGLLKQVTGKTSSRDLTLPEMGRVLDRLNGAGGRPRPANARPHGARPAPRSPQAMKARALWLSLYQLGAVRAPDHAGLAAFAARVLNRRGAEAHLDWIAPADLNRVVEALKSWCAREGFDVPDDVMEAKLGLLEVLWAKIVAAGRGTPGGCDTLGLWCVRKFGRWPSEAGGRVLDRAAEALGELLRNLVRKEGQP